MKFRNVKFEGKKDNGGPWCYLANDEDILAVGKTWDYCNVIESCPDNEMESSGADPGNRMSKSRDRRRARCQWKMQSKALHQFVNIPVVWIFSEIALGDGPENLRIRALRKTILLQLNILTNASLSKWSSKAINQIELLLFKPV